MTTSHTIVSRAEWVERRKALLAEEREFTRVRDRLSARRRELPWVRVEEDYTFEGASGRVGLRELFGEHSQLAVYHLMFAPEWEAACKSCSFWADTFDRNVVHLAARDIAFVAISSAPYPRLAAYRERMGWTFPWVSSSPCDFNRDFRVTFTPEEMASRAKVYNFGNQPPPLPEMPGASVFVKDGRDVFHTYSAYSRGIDMLNGAYQWMDLVPKGRDEAPGQAMAWLRRRDEYGR